eukprot:4560326-Pyramimonas_sp.AAC.1
MTGVCTDVHALSALASPMPSLMSAKTTGAHLAGSAHMMEDIHMMSAATVRKHPPCAARFRGRGGK